MKVTKKCIYAGYMQAINVQNRFWVAHGISESLGTWKNQAQRAEGRGAVKSDRELKITAHDTTDDILFQLFL